MNKLILSIMTLIFQPVMAQENLHQVNDQKKQPNIIICLTDDQGWGDVGYSGHKVLFTPNLDAMAKSGVRFNRFYSNAPSCSPTRAGTMTGRNNKRLGIGGPIAQGRGHMPKEEITLAEVLQSKGYATGHFGKWHLGDVNNPESDKHLMHPGLAGFDEWFSTQNVLPTYNPYRGKFAKSQHYYHNGKYVAEEDGIKGDDSKIIMDQALKFIDKQEQAKQPFFAFICFHAPHNPLILIPEYKKHYPEVKDAKKMVYYTNITAIDAAMGRLRNELRSLKIADDTILWFCSDNGPLVKGPSSPGSKGPYRGAKGELYEGGIRVPGLLEWPAVVKKPRIVEDMAVTTDLFPTTLDMIDAKLPDRPYDGVSLLPLIRGEALKRDEPIGFGANGWRALHDGRYKLVQKKGSKIWELYDMTVDPYEEKDIADKSPEILEAMIKKLNDWSNSCKASAKGEDYK